ncbi:hypothetical protein imdm_958 [gamma proteobacterium IMCC2047]|nr:hypothetical protein imdm_958 [gamma proteobacterium IMCC2047]
MKRVPGKPKKVRALISKYADSVNASLRKDVMIRIKNQLI